MEQHDPMCQVPVSYLNMLQERAADYVPRDLTRDANEIDSLQTAVRAAAIEAGVTPDTYEQVCAQRDRLAVRSAACEQRIAAFEDRAGCALEEIPVEALGRAQDAYVMQSAVDELKQENERLSKECNALGSELCDWRGKYKEALRQLANPRSAAARSEAVHAPYGFTKAGVPKKKPGGRGKRAA